MAATGMNTDRILKLRTAPVFEPPMAWGWTPVAGGPNFLGLLSGSGCYSNRRTLIGRDTMEAKIAALTIAASSSAAPSLKTPMYRFVVGIALRNGRHVKKPPYPLTSILALRQNCTCVEAPLLVCRP